MTCIVCFASCHKDGLSSVGVALFLPASGIALSWLAEWGWVESNQGWLGMSRSVLVWSYKGFHKAVISLKNIFSRKSRYRRFYIQYDHEKGPFPLLQFPWSLPSLLSTSSSYGKKCQTSLLPAVWHTFAPPFSSHLTVSHCIVLFTFSPATHRGFFFPFRPSTTWKRLKWVGCFIRCMRLVWHV